MKWELIALSLALLASTSIGSEEELPLAEPCDAEACRLPDCRCSSSSIPGGLNARDTPQFVLLTFDGAVNVINIVSYRSLLYDRKNFNSCPVGTTFFVNHEYNNYQLVNELHNNGFEIALNSITSQTSATYWATASYDDMKLEFADQIAQMTHFANIPHESLKGIRVPFLQMAGNASFQVIKDYGLQYDSTWATITDLNSGIWPYTLDYASTQDCLAPPCPTASIPGVWVLPIIGWLDLEGFSCISVGSCYYLPSYDDEEAWFRFFVGNFERHYLGSRAPFSFHINEWIISTVPAVRRAIDRFLDMINNLQDVFMVNSHEVIDWVRDPVPVDEYRQKRCSIVFPASCPAFSCGPLAADHNIWSSYWMDVCNVCPNVYPWIRNPLGQ